jgi:hypothetical protein
MSQVDVSSNLTVSQPNNGVSAMSSSLRLLGFVTQC